MEALHGFREFGDGEMPLLCNKWRQKKTTEAGLPLQTQQKVLGHRVCTTRACAEPARADGAVLYKHARRIARTSRTHIDLATHRQPGPDQCQQALLQSCFYTGNANSYACVSPPDLQGNTVCSKGLCDVKTGSKTSVGCVNAKRTPSQRLRVSISKRE